MKGIALSQEMADLSEDAAYTPVKKKLFAKLLKLQAEVGDPLNMAMDCIISIDAYGMN